MANLSACDKVLNTYELLEHILGVLPFKDLLWSKRVCNGFSSVIDRSVILLQKLYRSPVQGGETSHHPLKDTIFSPADNFLDHECLLRRHEGFQKKPDGISDH